MSPVTFIVYTQSHTYIIYCSFHNRCRITPPPPPPTSKHTFVFRIRIHVILNRTLKGQCRELFFHPFYDSMQSPLVHCGFNNDCFNFSQLRAYNLKKSSFIKLLTLFIHDFNSHGSMNHGQNSFF